MGESLLNGDDKRESGAPMESSCYISERAQHRWSKSQEVHSALMKSRA
jgi:hypothetical protein